MHRMIRDRSATVYLSVRVRNSIRSYDTVDDLESLGNPSMGRTGQITCKAEHEGLVKQKTIEPFIKDTIVAGTLVYTDEYSIYARLQSWGYGHKSVNHGRGEFARDEDGDGFCEVHVNTMEGFWSLLRSWLRPHRGRCATTSGHGQALAPTGPVSPSNRLVGTFCTILYTTCGM